MRLPNLAKTIMRNEQPIKLIRVVETIVNHRPTEQKTIISEFMASVQPANHESINKDKVDYSLLYVSVHSREEIGINDYIEYKGITYKAFECGDYSDYGFYKTIMEEQK